MSGRQMVRKALILLLAFSVHGCTWFNRDKVSVVHYDSSCLWNIKTGREYAAAGRYELAKEHFLLALASADSAENTYGIRTRAASGGFKNTNIALRGFMMKRLSQLAMLCIGLFFLYGIAYAASVPQIVSAMGRELDRQVAGKLGQGESPAQGLSLFVTTPVDVNNLSKSVPLARQVQEELMRWFVQAGYPVYEIRKSEGILFDENTGEMALTRQPDFLESGSPASGALLVGTYTVTARNVRFNVRVMQTADQNVIAMSTITIPINPEIAGLLTNDPSEGGGGMSIEPTVLSYLP